MVPVTPPKKGVADDDSTVEAASSGETAEEASYEGADSGCICHQPYHGEFMIGCDGGCEGWFHPSCVDLNLPKSPEAQEAVIDNWTCESCTRSEEQGGGADAAGASGLASMVADVKRDREDAEDLAPAKRPACGCESL